MHQITKKNLVAAKNIKKAIEDAIKNKEIHSISMDIKLLEEYSDEGELEEWESVSILHDYLNFYKDKTAQDVLENALRTYAKDDDVLVYFMYNTKEKKNREDKYFSDINARTKNNVDIDIYNRLGGEYREKIYKEVREKKEYKEYDKQKSEKFKEFQEKYMCDYQYENYNYHNYDEFLNKVVNRAKEIKKNESHVVENMREFLHKYGIFLLIEEKHDILDGVCGYVGEKKMPTIILYVDTADIKNLRRCFFTIAHELYHLLYGKGEGLANKFAGALLVSDVFDTLEEKLDITDTDETKKVLKKYREELGVSFECIINSLYDSKKIGSKQRSELLRYKWRYIDKGDIDLGEEEKWIYDSLGISK